MSVVTHRLEEGNYDHLGQVIEHLQDPYEEIHWKEEREARLANGLVKCSERRRHVP